MTIEATFLSPEPGLVRAKHLRAMMGQQITDTTEVELVVVAGTVARQRIHLVRKVSGRGRHVAFRCPRCGEPRTVLYAQRDGRLACARCAGHKTRRQLESSGTDWKENAVDHEDRIFRSLMTKNQTPAGWASIRRLVNEIVDGDHDRLAATMQKVAGALVVADAAVGVGAALSDHSLR